MERWKAGEVVGPWSGGRRGGAGRLGNFSLLEIVELRVAPKTNAPLDLDDAGRGMFRLEWVRMGHCNCFSHHFPNASS
jgi:hypothetical protein